MRLLILMLLPLFAACEAQRQDPAAATVDASLPLRADALRAASCPDDVNFARAEAVSLTTTPIDMPRPDFGDAVFVGGWALASEDERFGGLSGLDRLPSRTLLAASDSGAFVWISMDEQDAPTGSASLAFMRGANGEPLSGKRQGDAEGLVLAEGLALVSFERDHRILAYDLEGCGAGARGANAVDFADDTFGLNQSIDGNKGLEALAYDPLGGHLFAGLETIVDDKAPTAAMVETPSLAAFYPTVPAPDGKALTGFATTGSNPRDLRLYSVLRAYDRERGNRIDLQRTLGFNGDTETLFTLAKPVPVDNFEGLAARRLTNGHDRIYLVADDNFSDRQRTLLFIFDIAANDAAN